MSKWKSITLDEVADFKNGKSRPDQIAGADIPIYGGNGILGYSDFSNSKDQTIIIGRVGAYCGSVYYENRKIWVSDNALIVKAKEGNSPKFLYYLLRNMGLNNFAEGSSHPLLTQKLLNSLVIHIPTSLKEQRAIAGVLSSLDDKIDLLHRQNETLEALAQTLFRQWFVEEAEDEWEEKPLDEVADYLNGLACQKHPPKNETDKLPVLKIKELRNGISDKSDWANTDISEEYVVHNGDVIFSWSGSLLVKIWDGGDCILNQHLFKVTSLHYPKWLYYLWTKHHLQKFISIAESKSTTMGHIKRGDLANSMTLIPTEEELTDMDKVIAPLIDKIIANNHQIRTLEKLRDALLPKLISGEVRVQL